METATPGVKSTQDGWLNRYLHAREHEASTPFRAVALAPQLPRSLQGLEPALAIGQIGQFGIRGRSGVRHGAGVVRSRVRGGRPERAASDGPRGLRRGEDAEARRTPAQYTPENGADTRARRTATRSGRSRS